MFTVFNKYLDFTTPEVLEKIRKFWFLQALFPKFMFYLIAPSR